MIFGRCWVARTIKNERLAEAPCDFSKNTCFLLWMSCWQILGSFLKAFGCQQLIEKSLFLLDAFLMETSCEHDANLTLTWEPRGVQRTNFSLPGSFLGTPWRPREPHSAQGGPDTLLIVMSPISGSQKPQNSYSKVSQMIKQ